VKKRLPRITGWANGKEIRFASICYPATPSHCYLEFLARHHSRSARSKELSVGVSQGRQQQTFFYEGQLIVGQPPI
jgi:hypothetical protein